MKRFFVYAIIILLSCAANAQNKSTRAKLKQMLRDSKDAWEAVKDTTIDDESIAYFSMNGVGMLVVNGGYSHPYPDLNAKVWDKQKVQEGMEKAWKLNPSYIFLQWDKQCPNEALEFVVDQISAYMERCRPKQIAFDRSTVCYSKRKPTLSHVYDHSNIPSWQVEPELPTPEFICKPEVLIIENDKQE